MTKEFLIGHRQFQSEYVADERKFLERLASNGQNPDALYIGCSDSRVVPELLTNSAPGALFVLRNIANLVPTFDHSDSSVGAAIEYAVGHLKVSDIIICGHYGCGGVKAALDGLDKIKALPSLHEWLSDVRFVAEKIDSKIDKELRWRKAVEESVLHQMGNLLTYPVVKTALDAGDVRLHGWVYDLHTCVLSVYDAEKQTFIPANTLLP